MFLERAVRVASGERRSAWRENHVPCLVSGPETLRDRGHYGSGGALKCSFSINFPEGSVYVCPIRSKNRVSPI